MRQLPFADLRYPVGGRPDHGRTFLSAEFGTPNTYTFASDKHHARTFSDKFPGILFIFQISRGGYLEWKYEKAYPIA